MPGETRKLALIATKGGLDMAYPPFILASTAVALGYEVGIFFSFYGLQLLRKSLDHVRVTPVGNPAMPMPLPMPIGINDFRELRTQQFEYVDKSHLIQEVIDKQSTANRARASASQTFLGLRAAI